METKTSSDEIIKLCAEIERLEKTAFEPPWIADEFGVTGYRNGNKEEEVHLIDSATGDIGCEFIALSRTALPQLARRVVELTEELRIADKLIESRNEVLKALECPAHGQCVPGAIEKVESLTKENARLTGLLKIAKEMSEFYAESLRYNGAEKARAFLAELSAARDEGEKK